MELHDFHLTKEYILSLTSQEKIFEKYLYPPNTSGTYKNPFRVDPDAGCTFYYNKSILYFVDWSWNRKHYNCFDVVMAFYKCSFTKALEHIKQDLDKGHITRVEGGDVLNKPSKKKVLKIKTRDFKKVELDYWNIGTLTFTQEYLEKKGIYAVETIWENDWVIDNCHMTFAYIENGYITQIYFPLNKHTGRRRFINYEGFKIGGMGNLPIHSDFVVISKAQKCRFFMDELDIPNISIITETIVIEEELYSSLKLQYHNVLLLADNDFPGKRLAVKYRQKYPDVIILMFPKGAPKDFTDALAQYGAEYLLDLKNEMYNKLINKNERNIQLGNNGVGDI